ncbi:hypothetical protein OAA62_00875 [bacterium]|nr:hypothetical protein [bacterium]
MKQEKILQTIRQLVDGNLRYADAMDKINVERGQKLGVDGFTVQSAEEVLADIIVDLQSLEYELCLNGSMEGASL